MASAKKTDITKGILLIAFGKPGYGYAAYNMMQSIRRFNDTIPVTLLHDDEAVKYLESFQTTIFNDTVKLTKENYTVDGKFNPAKVKCEMYRYLPYDETLYLDVDGCALKDIEPLINQLSANKKPYQCDVVSFGGINDKLSYSWAANNNLWEYFKLKDTQTYYSVQTSFCYIKKGKEAEKIFNRIEENFHNNIFPFEKLSYKWGGTMPDELIVGGTLSQMNYDPESEIHPVFFGAKFDDRSFTKITEDHFILSIHGNGNGGTLTKLKYIDWYNKLMNITHPFAYKSTYIMRDKHANKRS